MEAYELEANLEEKFRRTRFAAELGGRLVGVVDFGNNPFVFAWDNVSSEQGAAQEFLEAGFWLE